MMYMDSRVLNNGTGAVDCTGGVGGKQLELVIVQYRINVDVILSKLIIVQDLPYGKKKVQQEKNGELISANLHTKN